MSKVYCLKHDKENLGVRTYYEIDRELFTKMNKQGWGVFLAVNDFEATQDQMDKLGVKTKRNIPFLEKINYVFADLDIGKAGDGQTREEREEKKTALLFEVYEVCPPSMVLDTSNGLQPLWKLKDSNTSEEYQARYVAVINAIIDWSKAHGGAGDKVKDVARILRMPNFNHMKEEPYMVKTRCKEDFIYTLEELEEKFKDYLKPPEEKQIFKPVDKTKLDDLSRAIEGLNFQDIIIRAFASTNRRAEFDKQNRIILDGRLTGTFQGKNGDRRYLASSSHEPFEGNCITAVADIKQITNKEARAWIIEEFGLRERVQKTKAKEILKPKELKKMKGYYSWGTRELTESFAPIKKSTYSIIGGGYGVGKTPFCVNLALANVELGHKVLYLSLEMDTEEIHDHLARKRADITISEEIYEKIPELKQRLYDEKRKELNEMEGFVLKGVRGGVDVTWEGLVGLIDGEFDLIIVDNFNLIKRIDRLNQYEHEGELSKRFLGLAMEKQTPIIVVHHYSKGGARELEKTGYSLGGNAKIMNDAQRIVLLERKTKYDEDGPSPTAKDKAILKVTLDKGRSYDRGIVKIIYFYKGGFLDYFPEPAPSWTDNI